MSSDPKDIPELDAAGLRKFGITTGAIIGLLFGLFFPWLLEAPWPVWPWGIFIVLSAWALASPKTLNPVYRGWMHLGLLLGRITTPLILGIVFYCLITPMGWLLRMTNKATMVKGFDRGLDSYRLTSHKAQKESMERPF